MRRTAGRPTAAESSDASRPRGSRNRMREHVVEREERQRDEERVPHGRRVRMRLPQGDRDEEQERGEGGRRTRVVQAVIDGLSREHAHDADQLAEHRKHEQRVHDDAPQGSSSRSKKRTNTIEPAKVSAAATTARIVYAERWKPGASGTSANVKTAPATCRPASASIRGAKTTKPSRGSSNATSAVAVQRNAFTGLSGR